MEEEVWVVRGLVFSLDVVRGLRVVWYWLGLVLFFLLISRVVG